MIQVIFYFMMQFGHFYSIQYQRIYYYLYMNMYCQHTQKKRHSAAHVFFVCRFPPWLVHFYIFIESKKKKMLPTVIGLSSIPFIIHPIDEVMRLLWYRACLDEQSYACSYIPQIRCALSVILILSQLAYCLYYLISQPAYFPY